jgi:hypothetical protein
VHKAVPCPFPIITKYKADFAQTHFPASIILQFEWAYECYGEGNLLTVRHQLHTVLKLKHFFLGSG